MWRQKINFALDACLRYRTAPASLSTAGSRILDCLKLSSLDEAEGLIHKYYGYLATNQRFGQIQPLRKKCILKLIQRELPAKQFEVHVASDSVSYFGEFSSIKKEWVLSRLLAYHTLIETYPEETELNLFVGDAWETNQPTLCASSNQSQAVLIPDAEFLGSQGYAAVRKYLSKNFIKWEERLPTVFWRGGVNAHPSLQNPWHKNPRIELCLRVKELSDTISADAGVVDLDYIYKEEAVLKKILNSGIAKNHVPFREFQNYKYQLDIDGYSNAWSSLFIKLLMGCVVFKVDSKLGFRQWYYDRLVPNENYVPIKSDLSDLKERIESIVNAPELASQIAQNARSTALSIASE